MHYTPGAGVTHTVTSPMHAILPTCLHYRELGPHMQWPHAPPALLPPASNPQPRPRLYYFVYPVPRASSGSAGALRGQAACMHAKCACVLACMAAATGVRHGVSLVVR